MKRVELNERSHAFPGAEWQMLGELELPVGSSTDQLICTWLTGLLAPLNLYESFLNKILKSAQDYVGRALQPIASVQFNHIHLSIYVPKEPIPKGNTWGFFRIEKINDTGENLAQPDHTVEFYLYLEQA